MIPFASLCVMLFFPDAPLETAAADLSALGCTFRLPPPDAARITQLKGCEFRFRSPAGERRCVLPRGAFTLSGEERTAGWTLFRLETDDGGFREASLEYMRAIRALKAPCPGEERDYPDTLDDAVREMLRGVHAGTGWGRGPDIFLELAEPAAVEDFLSLPAQEYFRRLLCRRGLGSHPLAEIGITGIQAGNPWCPALRPDRDALDRLREKNAREGLRLSLVLAPVREEETGRVLEYLEGAKEEITVNDWGTALLLGERKKTMGVLLNRRWKDVRHTSSQAALLSRNDAYGEEYLDFFRSLGFDRLEWEACGCLEDLPQMKGTLRLPFWQMSTSSRCPVRAVWEHGNRGRQFPPEPCGTPCREKTLLYERGSGMIFRWNTLFGCAAGALEDAAYIETAAARGVDRLLVDL